MAACATVLVIEDDDSMRKALGRLLTAAGYDSLCYASAEAMLLGPTDQDVVCAVCDQNLPGMSGLDLLAALRATRRAPPLILITAFDKPGLRAQAARSGAAAFLTKPFDGAALLDAICAAIISTSHS